MKRQAAGNEALPALGFRTISGRELWDWTFSTGEDPAADLPQAVFAMDLQGRVTWSNPAGYRITGYRPADLHQSLSAFELILPSNHARLRENRKTIFAGGEPTQRQYSIRCRNGEILPMLYHTTRFFRHGRVAGLRGLAMDLGEQLRTEQELAADCARIIDGR